MVSAGKRTNGIYDDARRVHICVDMAKDELRSLLNHKGVETGGIIRAAWDKGAEAGTSSLSPMRISTARKSMDPVSDGPLLFIYRRCRQ